ncbi:MAG TPA: CHRD domain-containing protein [Longimicrobiales bacterium]|nr:CHRD domain-containing protein [Longimicrobiales bacterium]
MRRYLFAAALIGVAFTACDDDDPLGLDDTETLNATLTGDTEVPGPGDDDGSGTAEIVLDDDDNEVCWDIQVEDITLPASAAHIHEGAAGVAGPIVVTLSAPDADGNAEGCVDASDDLIDDIIDDPEDYYVNVHTSDFPDGAVRGQLRD